MFRYADENTDTWYLVLFHIMGIYIYPAATSGGRLAAPPAVAEEEVWTSSMLLPKERMPVSSGAAQVARIAIE